MISNHLKYPSTFPSRHSIRLKGYDYSQSGMYFITICVQKHTCLFGKIMNGEMILNEYGQIAHNEWAKTPEIRSNVELDVFVVMPNHIHGIIVINNVGRGVSHTPTSHTPTSHTPTSHTPTSHTPTSHTPTTHTPTSHTPTLHTPITHTPHANAGACIHGNNANNIGGTGDYLGGMGDYLGKMGDYLGGRCDNMGGTGDYLGGTGVCNTPLRSPSNTIGAIVRGYKSAVTGQLNKLGYIGPIWQRNYWDNIIRNEQSYQHIANYIINNPTSWKNDRFYITGTWG